MEKYDFNNHVYLFGEIDNENAINVIKELRKIDRELMRVSSVYKIPPIPIRLHISSFGGHLAASFAVANTLFSLDSPVYTVVDGACASGATIISVCGAERYCHPNTQYLIHQLSGCLWGNYKEMEDRQYNSSMRMEQMIEHYLKYTSMDRDMIEKSLQDEKGLTAQEAVQAGLVDHII